MLLPVEKLAMRSFGDSICQIISKSATPKKLFPGSLSSRKQKRVCCRRSFRKNALKKQDLERLNDSELLLLPLTDFWDSKKKNWKTNVYGNFGKRNSDRMKNLFGQEKF
tara:strand:- start:157 stop:483 length:327 start_codon:yes stop_codon:yes gene_type:complete